MYFYEKQERQFICLPADTDDTNDTNDSVIIRLNEIISIEPYDNDTSIITLSTGKEIYVSEKVEKFCEILKE